MSYSLRCITLFDITASGVSQRNKPVDMDLETYVYRRNTQCNFDTILQAISLRSLPEITSMPVKITLSPAISENFGYVLMQNPEPVVAWSFDFQVGSISVFNNRDGELGALYADCESVPMIICGTEIPALCKSLEINAEQRNIYFYVLDHDQTI